jgi:hypothetical protein
MRPVCGAPNCSDEEDDGREASHLPQARRRDRAALSEPPFGDFLRLSRSNSPKDNGPRTRVLDRTPAGPPHAARPTPSPSEMPFAGGGARPSDETPPQPTDRAATGNDERRPVGRLSRAF